MKQFRPAIFVMGHGFQNIIGPFRKPVDDIEFFVVVMIRFYSLVRLDL